LIAIGPSPTDGNQWLTPREQVILQHLLLGKSVREIAAELERSPHTVHDHVKALHRKLNASSRGELVARALGYIQPETNGSERQQQKDVLLPTETK
jgi:DNA-binding NarL/FixJ family response regulator